MRGERRVKGGKEAGIEAGRKGSVFSAFTYKRSTLRDFYIVCLSLASYAYS